MPKKQRGIWDFLTSIVTKRQKIEGYLSRKKLESLTFEKTESGEKEKTLVSPGIVTRKKIEKRF